MSFPDLILATLVVGAGIYALDQFSPTAAWMLTILILIIVALRYQKFAEELSKLLSVSSPGGNQDPNFDASAVLQSLNNSIPLDSSPVP